MTPRDLLGIACVFWPALRTPVALADLVVGLAGRVRLEEGGRVWLGDDWTVGVGVDWRTWALGVALRVPDPEDGDHVVSAGVQVGPFGAQVEYLGPSEGDDDLVAPGTIGRAA